MLAGVKINLSLRVGPRRADLRGGEENRLDVGEVVLGAHALEEHRSHHAPPSDDAYASHCHDSNVSGL